MLPFRTRPPLLCALTLMVTLAGCSGEQESDGTKLRQAENSAVQFSEEERRAARVLSITSRNTVQEAGSPYDEAVACSSAIEELVDRMRRSEALDGEQLQIIERAKAVYDHRISNLTSQTSAADRANDEGVQQGTEDTPIGGKPLQALGCIQKLAEAG